jgi:hypothetical protein
MVSTVFHIKDCPAHHEAGKCCCCHHASRYPYSARLHYPRKSSHTRPYPVVQGQNAHLDGPISVRQHYIYVEGHLDGLTRWQRSIRACSAMSTACVNTTNRTAVHELAYLQHLIKLHHMELFCMPSTSMLDLHEDGQRLQTSERLDVISMFLGNRRTVLRLTTATAIKRSSNPKFLTRHARVMNLPQISDRLAESSLHYLPYGHEDDSYHIQRNTRVIQQRTQVVPHRYINNMSHQISSPDVKPALSVVCEYSAAAEET